MWDAGKPRESSSLAQRRGTHQGLSSLGICVKTSHMQPSGVGGEPGPLGGVSGPGNTVPCAGPPPAPVVNSTQAASAPDGPPGPHAIKSSLRLPCSLAMTT